MADDKTTVYQITYDVEEALRRLRILKDELKGVDKLSKGAGSERAQRWVKQETAARNKLNAAVKTYRQGVKTAEKEAVKSARNIERAIKADERATRKLAREMDKAAKAAVRAREKFKRTFLSIGKSSSFGMGSMIRNAAAATLAYVSLYRIISKIGEAKDRYLRFDELTTATMTIAKAGDAAFEHGSKGAERYRDALREAADEVKAAASEMADSALFWAKAGQTNANTIVELSKIGTLFARANRDAANNVLDQARANDILSDALQLFRKDTSTTEKAKAEATSLGDKLTAAANASNIVVEQLFDYSKKVAGLFKAGEYPDEEIMAIAASLASAGLKEESGVHVRRIMTRLAGKEVQALLKESGIDVADKAGNIRSFGKIFGELQEVLKKQKPLERMSYLKELFGQRALSTAAAMAGLQEEGMPGETSIKAILDKIADAEGMARRNQEQYLATTAGRVKALTSMWGNAFDKMLEDSGIIEKMLSGLEGIDPEDLFAWIQETMVPALESFGITMRDTVIPGIQMAAQNLSEWFSPALSVVSNLLGGTTSNAEGLASTITTLVKLWVKWRIAMLAIRGLRMVDWLAGFAKQALAAAAATKAIGTSTVASVAASKGALATLPAAFTGVGIAIVAAIAAWGLYEALVGPIEDAIGRLNDFEKKYGKGFSKLKPGQEKFETLQGRIRDLRKARSGIEGLETIGSAGASPYGVAIQAQQTIEARRRRDEIDEEIRRLELIQAEQVRKEYGYGTSTAYQSGQSLSDETWDTKTSVQEHLNMYQREREALEQERDETIDKLADAIGDERDVLKESLDVVVDRLKDNADAIQGYTSDLDGIASSMIKEQEREQAADRAATVTQARAAARRGAFRGGRSEPLNPFATPFLSGQDPEGNRIVNLALQKGGATDYFQKSPEAREKLARELRQNKNVINIHYGDASISVTAKTGAKPQDIAKAVKDEWWKIGRRNQEDVQRVLGATVPAEI
jgi:TP901 family phage tail tape measure protein